MQSERAVATGIVARQHETGMEEKSTKTTTKIECETLFGKRRWVSKKKIRFRPSAYGIVLQENRVLLVKNWRTGKFMLPGGGLGIEETAETALQREIREETGIAVSDPVFVQFAENFFFYDPLKEAYHGLMFLYRCKPATTQLIDSSQVNDAEATEPQWVPIAELKPADFNNFGERVLDCIRMVAETGKKPDSTDTRGGKGHSIK